MTLGYFAPPAGPRWARNLEYPTGGYKVLSPGPGAGPADWAKLGVPTRYLSAEEVYGGPILGIGTFSRTGQVAGLLFMAAIYGIPMAIGGSIGYAVAPKHKKTGAAIGAGVALAAMFI